MMAYLDQLLMEVFDPSFELYEVDPGLQLGQVGLDLHVGRPQQRLGQQVVHVRPLHHCFALPLREAL